MPTINEFLGTSNYGTAADGERTISDPTANGAGLTTSDYLDEPSGVINATINATGGTTFQIISNSFGPNMRKDGVYGDDYLPSGCSISVDGVDESTRAGWLVSHISLSDMAEEGSYVRCTFGPLDIEFNNLGYNFTSGYNTSAFSVVWPGGSYAREITLTHSRGNTGLVYIALNGSKVGFYHRGNFLAEYDFVTVPKNYVFSDFEMYSPDSGYTGRTSVGYQRQYWGGDPPPEPVAAGIRPLRKFQTLTGSPGGGRPLRKFQNGGHSGGRPLRKFATGI